MRVSRSWRKSGLALCACLLLAGCYGPCNLWHRLHKWNGTVDGKWGNEGVFLVLTIIPVYGLAMLADIIIFNSIEFWSGSNPIDPPSSASIEINPDSTTTFWQGDRAVAMQQIGNDQVEVKIYEKDLVIARYTIEKDSVGSNLLDANGNLVAKAHTNANGEVIVDQAAN